MAWDPTLSDSGVYELAFVQNGVLCAKGQENVTFPYEPPDLLHSTWKWPPCFFGGVCSLKAGILSFLSISQISA